MFLSSIMVLYGPIITWEEMANDGKLQDEAQNIFKCIYQWKVMLIWHNKHDIFLGEAVIF